MNVMVDVVGLWIWKVMCVFCFGFSMWLLVLVVFR